MIHQADFSNAHRRHWKDAELLFGNGRLPNADQLYGFSAECGLKAVMKALGMPIDVASGKPKLAKHRQHVQKLWLEFANFAQGRAGGRYAPLLPSGKPFANWSQDDRYAHSRVVSLSGTRQHRIAARGVCHMVQQAVQDGLL